MITIEFYWNDLTEKKQKEIIDLIGDNNNWDYFPIATLDIEEDPLQFENNLVKDDEGNDMLVIEIYNYPMESWMEV